MLNEQENTIKDVVRNLNFNQVLRETEYLYKQQQND